MSATDHTIEYELTPQLTRDAAWRFFVRYDRLRIALAALFFIGGAYYGLAQDNVSWLLFGVVIALIPLIRCWIYMRRAVSILDSMSNKRVSVTFRDDGVRFLTSEHEADMKWSVFKGVWRFKSVWLVFTYSKDSFSLIPAACLGPELRDLIVRKIRENDGKIV